MLAKRIGLLYCLELKNYIIFYICNILMNTLQHPAVFPEMSVSITCENHCSPLLLAGMRCEGCNPGTGVEFL